MGDVQNTVWNGSKSRMKEDESMKTPMLNEMLSRLKEQVEIAALKDELDKLIDECDAVTRTNCGWQQYRINQVIIDYAKYLQSIRDWGYGGDKDE